MGRDAGAWIPTITAMIAKAAHAGTPAEEAEATARKACSLIQKHDLVVVTQDDVLELKKRREEEARRTGADFGWWAPRYQEQQPPPPPKRRGRPSYMFKTPPKVIGELGTVVQVQYTVWGVDRRESAYWNVQKVVRWGMGPRGKSTVIAVQLDWAREAGITRVIEGEEVDV